MRIYGHDLSGHTHRARLTASILGLDTEFVPVDLLAGAHKQPEFLDLNPFGQVPVLVDGDVTLYDSNAISVYLATRYDSGRTLLPVDPVAAAEVQIWLSRAANELANGPAAARLVTVFGAGLDHAATIEKANAFLGVVNTHLAGRRFLVGDDVTLADIALYSYIAHAPEGGVDLAPYAEVRAWLTRIEAVDGFFPMPATETDALRTLTA